MKSKTAIAALAATLAMCLPTKASSYIVDATHSYSFTFSGINPFALPLPSAEFYVDYSPSNFLNPGESVSWSVYDQSHTLLATGSQTSFGPNDLNFVDIFAQFSSSLTTTGVELLLESNGGSVAIMDPVRIEYFDAHVGTFHQLVGVAQVHDVAPVPGPIVGAGVPGLVAAFGLFGWKRRQKKKATT